MSPLPLSGFSDDALIAALCLALNKRDDFLTIEGIREARKRGGKVWEKSMKVLNEEFFSPVYTSVRAKWSYDIAMDGATNAIEWFMMRNGMNTYDPSKGPIEPYLKGKAHAECISIFRGPEQRKPELLGEEDVNVQDPKAIPSTIPPEFWAMLKDRIDRQILRLHCEGKDVKTIGKKVGLKQGAVYIRLKEIRIRLNRFLVPREFWNTLQDPLDRRILELHLEEHDPEKIAKILVWKSGAVPVQEVDDRSKEILREVENRLKTVLGMLKRFVA